MLTGLTVKNLKSISEAQLQFSTVNVLIGANGSGKSTLIQALTLLKQSLGQNNLVVSGSLVDLGTFRDVARKPLLANPEVELGISGILSLGKDFQVGAEAVNSTSFRVNWAFGEGNIVRLGAEHRFGSVSVEARWNSVTGGSVRPPFIVVNGISFGLGLAIHVYQAISVQNTVPPPDSDAETVGGTNQAVNKALQGPGEMLRTTFIVPTIRGVERTAYELADQAVTDFASSQGSARVGQALATTLVYGRPLEATISNWMERITGRKLQGRALPPRMAAVNAVAFGKEVNMANEGFGTNQLSLILTQLALLPSDSTLAVEEPEIHLHPAAQTKMMNVLVEAIRKAESRLLLTTHSEHILYALMSLVADGTLKPDDVTIHYLENNEGTTTVRRLEMDSSGRVAGGLPGFFDVQVQEFRRYLEAVENKQ